MLNTCGTFTDGGLFSLGSQNFLEHFSVIQFVFKKFISK